MGQFSRKKHEEANDALLNTVNTDAQLVAAEITKALGDEGAITSAISAAITTAIGENGDIEQWGDGRYTKKTE